MKFKGKVRFDEVAIPSGHFLMPDIRISGIEVEYESEYTIGEAKGAYDLMKAALKDVPEIVEGIKNAVIEMQKAEAELTPAKEEPVAEPTNIGSRFSFDQEENTAPQPIKVPVTE